MRAGRWAVAGMVAVAVAVGAGANAVDDNFLASGWHTMVRGDPGADLEVGNYQVHVHGAAASPHLDDDGPVTSPGLFVIVDLAYATTDSWHSPQEIVLVGGDGSEFTQPSGFGSAGQPWLAGPDVWFRGDLLFEVPADAVDDLALEIRPESPIAQLPATILRVPLAVSTESTPLTLEHPEVLAEGER